MGIRTLHGLAKKSGNLGKHNTTPEEQKSHCECECETCLPHRVSSGPTLSRPANRYSSMSRIVLSDLRSPQTDNGQGDSKKHGRSIPMFLHHQTNITHTLAWVQNGFVSPQHPPTPQSETAHTRWRRTHRVFPCRDSGRIANVVRREGPSAVNQRKSPHLWSTRGYGCGEKILT